MDINQNIVASIKNKNLEIRWTIQKEWKYSILYKEGGLQFTVCACYLWEMAFSLALKHY
jgi:hypothetical protein